MEINTSDILAGAIEIITQFSDVLAFAAGFSFVLTLFGLAASSLHKSFSK